MLYTLMIWCNEMKWNVITVIVLCLKIIHLSLYVVPLRIVRFCYCSVVFFLFFLFSFLSVFYFLFSSIFFFFLNIDNLYFCSSWVNLWRLVYIQGVRICGCSQVLLHLIEWNMQLIKYQVVPSFPYYSIHLPLFPHFGFIAFFY